jgi:UDP-N-acetylglucosamine--N-acetylmuramyl-(pentapeptide) pyrophosphoryl-undecaprenol N-acetylglucosamine transferase
MRDERVRGQDQARKIFIAAGGTGGHIFPALRTASELKKLGHDIFFIGVFKAGREKIAQQGYPVIDLPASGFVSGQLRVLAGAGINLMKSFCQVWSILKKENPDVILGFGAYAAFPTVFAAALQGRPTVIHEQNVRPGRANRLLAFFVRKIAVSFEASLAFFPAQKTVVTGYPCRSLSFAEKSGGLFQYFGLTPGIFTIFVLGGSQGSHNINAVFMEALAQLNIPGGFQILHATGTADFSDFKKRYHLVRQRHYLAPFLVEMEKAYAVADLVICRAGAGTITELAGTNRPAVIIPYRFAGGHQRDNAQLLAGSGPARIIAEVDLTPARLIQEIGILYQKIGEEKGRLSQYPLGVYRPEAATRLAKETLAVVKA